MLALPLAILSTPIITADGAFTARTIGDEEARALVAEAEGVDNYVGHPSTAQLLTHALGVELEVARGQFAQQPGQNALAFKVNGRLPQPGTELSREDLERIGWTFKLIIRTV